VKISVIMSCEKSQSVLNTPTVERQIAVQIKDYKNK